MGGAAAGEVASQMAVDILYTELLDLEPGLEPQAFAEILDRAISTANHRIHELAKADQTKRGMGTTVSAAAIYGNVLFLAQVGDSRAYLLRGGKLIQVTKDQSLLERLLEDGAISPEHAQNFTGRNVILQALGPTPQVLVDLKFIELEEDDVLLLCSDGLHGPVSTEEIIQCLYSSSSLQTAGQALIDRANHNGGPDNITVILSRFTGPDLPKPSVSTPAIPQPVKYVRSPVDTFTLKLEKQLGLTHWLNKYFFAPPLLILYALLLVGGTGWALWSNRAAFSVKKSAPIISPHGTLVVTSDIPDAELYVGGLPMGHLKGGGKSLTLPAGSHSIYLRSGNWTSPVHKLVLTGNEREPPLLDISQKQSASNRPKIQTSSETTEWLPGRDDHQ
jgi:serine/threonine protein phosphatase PrpC